MRGLLDDGAGRRALVAGAAGGIGAAVARAFAEAGVEVIAADLRAPDPAPGMIPRACDVADETAVRALCAEAEALGGIDYLVNAAGIGLTASLADLSLEDWRRVMDANLTSCFLLAREARAMLVARRGAVVFCGSSNGINGGSRLSSAAYAVAKAGVHNLTRYLAKEWAPDGVRVNAIAPGPIDTPMIGRFDADTRERLRRTVPLGRDGTPEEVAANVLFLCSRHAAWQTGTVVNISGGLVL